MDDVLGTCTKCGSPILRTQSRQHHENTDTYTHYPYCPNPMRIVREARSWGTK